MRIGQRIKFSVSKAPPGVGTTHGFNQLIFFSPMHHVSVTEAARMWRKIRSATEVGFRLQVRFPDWLERVSLGNRQGVSRVCLLNFGRAAGPSLVWLKGNISAQNRRNSASPPHLDYNSRLDTVGWKMWWVSQSNKVKWTGPLSDRRDMIEPSTKRQQMPVFLEMWCFSDVNGGGGRGRKGPFHPHIRTPWIHTDETEPRESTACTSMVGWAGGKKGWTN